MQNFTGPKAIGPSTLEARLAPKAMAGNMGLCMEMKPCLHITQTHPLADFQKQPTSVLDLWEPQKVNLAEPEPIVEISLFCQIGKPISLNPRPIRSESAWQKCFEKCYSSNSKIGPRMF